MKELKTFSEDAFQITQKAGYFSKKYYHTFCGTVHLFLATMSFFTNTKNTQRYAASGAKFKELLKNADVSGPEFEKQFLLICPKGVEPDENAEFLIQPDIEYNKVIDGLKRRFLEEKRTMEVEDLLVELFGDKSYTLFSVISAVSGSDQKTEKLYNEIIKAFKPKKKAASANLDKIPELTNLNKYVEENPQTIIGMKKALDQTYTALCGRVNPNVMLVGKAGVGKTTVMLALADAINKGTAPAGLAGKTIYQLDPTALISGTRLTVSLFIQ